MKKHMKLMKWALFVVLTFTSILSYAQQITETVRSRHANGKPQLVWLIEGKGKKSEVIGSIKYYENGNAKDEVRPDGSGNYVKKQYYENGVLKSVGLQNSLAPLSSSGLLGEWKVYHPNGQLKQLRQYNDGPVGEWKSYHDNGMLKAVGKVNRRDGREGEWKYYDREGKLVDTKIFKDMIYEREISYLPGSELAKGLEF